jgi:hypothetical protein
MSLSYPYPSFPNLCPSIAIVGQARSQNSDHSGTTGASLRPRMYTTYKRASVPKISNTPGCSSRSDELIGIEARSRTTARVRIAMAFLALVKSVSGSAGAFSKSWTHNFFSAAFLCGRPAYGKERIQISLRAPEVYHYLV